MAADPDTILETQLKEDIVLLTECYTHWQLGGFGRVPPCICPICCYYFDPGLFNAHFRDCVSASLDVKSESIQNRKRNKKRPRRQRK